MYQVTLRPKQERVRHYERAKKKNRGNEKRVFRKLARALGRMSALSEASGLVFSTQTCHQHSRSFSRRERLTQRLCKLAATPHINPPGAPFFKFTSGHSHSIDSQMKYGPLRLIVLFKLYEPPGTDDILSID